MNKLGINQLLNKKANPNQSWPLNKNEIKLLQRYFLRIFFKPLLKGL